MIVDYKEFSGLCTCGREHNMTTKVAVIESGCLKKAGEYLTHYGQTGKRCVLYGSNSYKATEDRRLSGEQIIVLDSEGLHADEESVAIVLEQLKDDIEVVVSIGGGSIHDIGRYCAYERGLRFVSCPTCASVDGFCSSVAAMTWYGYKKTLTAVAPELVLADTEVISKAPFRLVKSGIGDIIAKYTALADWEIANVVTGEYLCRRIYDIVLDAANAAMTCIPGLINGDEDAYAKVINALLMSGVAMQMIGNSRPASGAEHHISHLIEMGPVALNVAFPALHGEKAGVGSIAATREYKRLAELEDIVPYLSDFSPVSHAVMKTFFGGRLADAIINENSNDCLAAVNKDALISSWPSIRQIISDIPSPDDLYGLLEQMDAKRELPDIGVSNEDAEMIFEYSPLVRNRLTLMRIRRLIKCRND